MNSFNVATPEEWKKNLYAKTTKTKTVRIKPIAILAAVLAVIICISGSSFAVRVSKAPEYFGSVFLGNSENADQVYSEKNYAFESSRDDLNLYCKGIVGDDYDLHILFELTSSGDILFDENKTYFFEDHDQIIPFATGYGKSMRCEAVDERTLEIGVYFGGVEGGRVVGNTISMDFRNIEVYEKNTFNITSLIDCDFSGKIVVDYSNTQNKLKATENTVNFNGVTFKPIKGEISNLNFAYTLEVIEGKELFENIMEEDFIVGKLTLNYNDGTSESFRLKMPPEDERDVSAGVIGKRGNKLNVQLSLPGPVSANRIVSVELNDVEVFVK